MIRISLPSAVTPRCSEVIIFSVPDPNSIPSSAYLPTIPSVSKWNSTRSILGIMKYSTSISTVLRCTNADSLLMKAKTCVVMVVNGVKWSYLSMSLSSTVTHLLLSLSKQLLMRTPITNHGVSATSWLPSVNALQVVLFAVTPTSKHAIFGKLSHLSGTATTPFLP